MIRQVTPLCPPPKNKKRVQFKNEHSLVEVKEFFSNQKERLSTKEIKKRQTSRNPTGDVLPWSTKRQNAPKTAEQIKAKTLTADQMRSTLLKKIDDINRTGIASVYLTATQNGFIQKTIRQEVYDEEDDKVDISALRTDGQIEKAITDEIDLFRETMFDLDEQKDDQIKGDPEDTKKTIKGPKTTLNDNTIDNVTPWGIELFFPTETLSSSKPVTQRTRLDESSIESNTSVRTDAAVSSPQNKPVQTAPTVSTPTVPPVPTSTAKASKTIGQQLFRSIFRKEGKKP